MKAVQITGEGEKQPADSILEKYLHYDSFFLEGVGGGGAKNILWSLIFWFVEGVGGGGGGWEEGEHPPLRSASVRMEGGRNLWSP